MPKKIPIDLGWGGANEDQLKDLLYAAVDSMNSLKAQVDDLQTKYNQHITDGKHRVATNVDAAAPLSATASVVSITK